MRVVLKRTIQCLNSEDVSTSEWKSELVTLDVNLDKHSGSKPSKTKNKHLTVDFCFMYMSFKLDSNLASFTCVVPLNNFLDIFLQELYW